MGKKQTPLRLSAGEMELMSMLWEQGPLSLADAHQRFTRYGDAVAYPTMQTRLNRLVEKKLAKKSSARPAVYRAAVSREQAALGHLDQLLDKLGESSIAPLVCHLISERPLTRQEIAEVKRLLLDAEKTNKQSRSQGD